MWMLKLFAVVFLMLVFVPDADCWRRRRRRRYSPPCSPHDCQVSSWSEWSPCTHQCGTSGKQKQTRTITVAASCGGSCPFVLIQTRSCNRINCQNSSTTTVLAMSTLQPRHSSSILTTTQTPLEPVSTPSPFIETGMTSFQPAASQAVIISPSLTIPAVNSQPLSVVPVASTIAPTPLSSGFVVTSPSTIKVTTQPPFIACGGTLNGSSGSFASPGYPGFYPNNLNCLWTLSIPANGVLRLQFVVFETEQLFDFVELTNIFGQKIKWLSGSRSGFTITVRGDRTTLLRIRFITDYTYTRQGFKAHYNITFAPISSLAPTPSSSAVIATPTPTMQITTRPSTGQDQRSPPRITDFLKGNLLNRDEVKGGKEYNELNNDGFKLPCEATGQNLKWTWQHNGTNIFTGFRSKYKVQGDGSLIGESLLPDQSGNYQCFVEDTVTGKRTFSRKVQVLVTYIRPFLSTAPRTITVDLGQPLQIPCPAHGASYGAVYTWSGGENIKFPRNDRRAISATGELFIMFVTEDDIKLTEQLKGISCTITGANTIFKSGPLTLKKRAGSVDPGTPQSPSWKITPGASETAVEGRNKTLYCFAVGRPPPAITWKKNGQTVVTGDYFEIASTFQGRRLDLIYVKKDIHEDTYTCEAENSQNSGNPVVFTLRLTVEVAPKWRDSKPPPEKLEIDIQGSATLLCDAVGDPAPAFTWYKDGERLLSSTSHVQMTANKLTFKNVILPDDGMYQCVAENKLDMIVSSTWVNVLVKSPSFKFGFGPFYLFKDSEGSLNCEPDAVPPPIFEWSKVTGNNQGDIKPGGRYKLFPNGTLVIANVTQNDEGRYSCKATNFLNSASATADASVLERTRIVVKPADKLVKEGDDVDLRCRAEYDKDLEIRYFWKRDDARIDYIQDVVEWNVSKNVLTISNIKVEDAGVYTCIAYTPEPKRSEDSASAIVNIQVEPSVSSLPPLSVAPTVTVTTDIQRALVDLLRSLVEIIQRLQALVGGSFSQAEFEDFRNQTLQILQQAENQLVDPSSSRLRNIRKVKREIPELSSPQDLVQMIENIQRRLLG